MNCIDSCREDLDVVPWFVGLRTDRNGWLLGDDDGNADYEKSSEFNNPELMNWIDVLPGLIRVEVRVPAYGYPRVPPLY